MRNRKLERLLSRVPARVKLPLNVGDGCTCLGDLCPVLGCIVIDIKLDHISLIQSGFTKNTSDELKYVASLGGHILADGVRLVVRRDLSADESKVADPASPA